MGRDTQSLGGDQITDMWSEQTTTNVQQKSSNALRRFQSLHPDQHELFSSIFNRNSVFPLPSQSEEIDGEWSNMVRNTELIKFREDDKLFEAKEMRKYREKTVTWRENLVDIKPITPQGFSSPWSKSFDIQNSYKNVPVEKWPKKEESDVGEETRKYGRSSYAEVVTGTTKYTNKVSSYQSFLRKR